MRSRIVANKFRVTANRRSTQLNQLRHHRFKLLKLSFLRRQGIDLAGSTRDILQSVDVLYDATSLPATSSRKAADAACVSIGSSGSRSHSMPK